MTPTQRLVFDHICADAHYKRQATLQQWNLAEHQITIEIEREEDALVALCAARPIKDCDVQLRRAYLSEIDVPARIDGCDDLAKRVVKALIGDGVAL